LHIPALIALILSIAGGTDEFSSNVSDHSTGKSETRAGILIFLAVYICLFLLTVITFGDWAAMQGSQRRIFVCILLALPLMAVRLVYSLLSDFSSNTQFSIVDGSPTIQLVMATVEELLIAVMYSILGVITPRTESMQDNDQAVHLSAQPQDPEYAQIPTDHARSAARNAYQGRY
jgi:hypothetical protein